MIKTILMSGVAVMALSSSAYAAYTTVDISGFTNTQPSLGEGTYPTGLSSGNQGLGVPFNISGTNGNMNIYLSPSSSASSTLNLTSLGLTGQVTFYALLNNYYGTPGLDEYNVTISTVQGPSYTFSSIGGVDTRDYNQNFYTNTLAPTTMTWFNNGTGQRLDLRQFTLPTSFAADTISGFTITQNNNGDLAFFSGLTFSNAAGIIPTPEPASIAVLASALFGVAGLRRRSRISSPP